jgi:hypothetical protein
MPNGAARCQALRAEATASQTLAALNCKKADAVLTLEAIRSAQAVEQAYVIGPTSDGNLAGALLS